MPPPRPWDGGRQVNPNGRYYVECPAATATVLAEDLGGAEGDAIDQLWIFPATVTPGALTLADGATVLYAWPAGITLNDTRPIYVPLYLRSREGAWTVTAGANISALASGQFS